MKNNLRNRLLHGVDLRIPLPLRILYLLRIMSAPHPPTTTLKQSLTAIHLWAIAVGLVISGDYFGWSYGWGEAGTIGFLIVTLVVALLYVTFIFSFTELTTAIPHAGGPFAYALKALGPYGGVAAGYASLVEFLFAAPAIAFALGSYIHFLYPTVAVMPVALVGYVIFTGLNFLGIKESALFTLLVTLLAVAELLVYMGIVAPHFSLENFVQDALPLSVSGMVKSVPFAIWFFLAMEGVAMVAEEVKDPHKNIPRGYIYGIVTLVFLAFGVMIFTGGVGPWKRMTGMDYPLPEAIAMALGRDSKLTSLFTSIGLFGLIASFHGIIISYSRQVFALARSGFLPAALAVVNKRFRTPHRALIAGSLVGMVAVLSGTTDKLIILSVIGALTMYSLSMVSLFRLRRQAPFLPRPMRAPFYPFFPALALVLSCACLVSIAIYNLWLTILFVAGLALMLLVFRITRHGKPQEFEDLYIPERDGHASLTHEA
jgi:ethanolamine permease